jgi:GT2 family glycosyltransferase
MLTSVIIPCWNALDLTRVCLRQLVRRTTLDYEVVIVDNGSVDGSGDWLKAFRAKALRENPHGTLRRFEIVTNAVNRGYPAAMNQGIREARGSLLLFGNSDAAVTPLWLEEMRAALRSRGSAIGGVSAFGNVPRAPGSPIRWESRPAYRGIKGLERFARAKLLQGRAPVYFPAAGFFPGFWFLTKDSVIRKVGVFDERYGQGGFEDFDLQWRMRRAGYELGFAGRSYVHHVGFGCGEKNGLKNREFYGERKATAFYDKFPAASPVAISTNPEFWLRASRAPRGSGV